MVLFFCFFIMFTSPNQFFLVPCVKLTKENCINIVLCDEFRTRNKGKLVWASKDNEKTKNQQQFQNLTLFPKKTAYFALLKFVLLRICVENFKTIFLWTLACPLSNQVQKKTKKKFTVILNFLHLRKISEKELD